MRSGQLTGSIIVVLLLFITAALQTAGAGEPAPALGIAFPSVRAYAMGGAYTAIASDMSALQANPAGLGQSGFELSLGTSAKNLELISAYRPKDIWDLVENQTLDLTGQMGTSAGRMGLGIFARGTLKRYADGAGSGKDLAMDDISARVSAGFSVPLQGQVRIGFAGNYIRSIAGIFIIDTERGWMEYGDWTNSAGYSANVGVLAKKGVLSAGFVAQDIVSLLNATTNTGAKSVYMLSPTFQAGVAMQLPGIIALGPITLAADYQLPGWVKGFNAANELVANRRDGAVRLGAETNLLFNLLSLRAGQVLYPGDRTLTTLGLGINLLYFHADLAIGTESAFEEPELSNALLQVTMRF